MNRHGEKERLTSVPIQCRITLQNVSYKDYNLLVLTSFEVATVTTMDSREPWALLRSAHKLLLLLTSVSQRPSSSGCCWLQQAHLSPSTQYSYVRRLGCWYKASILLLAVWDYMHYEIKCPFSAVIHARNFPLLIKWLHKMAIYNHWTGLVNWHYTDLWTAHCVYASSTDNYWTMQTFTASFFVCTHTVPGTRNLVGIWCAGTQVCCRLYCWVHTTSNNWMIICLW